MSRSSQHSGLSFISRPEQGVAANENARSATIINETAVAAGAIAIGAVVQFTADPSLAGVKVITSTIAQGGCGVFLGVGGTGAGVSTLRAALTGDEIVFQRAGPALTNDGAALSAGDGVSSAAGAMIALVAGSRIEGVALEDADATETGKTTIQLMYV